MTNRNGKEDLYPELVFIDHDDDVWRQCNVERNKWCLLASKGGLGVTFAWLVHEYGPGTVLERDNLVIENGKRSPRS